MIFERLRELRAESSDVAKIAKKAAMPISAKKQIFM